MALPTGTWQLKDNAVPAKEVSLRTLHSWSALQVALPKPSVSQTKRMRLPGGGVIVSVMRTLVPKDGPLLVTRTL